MRISTKALSLTVLGLAASAAGVAAQSAHSESSEVAQVRDDRFKWYFGAQGGALLFQTQSQTRSGIPAFGAHLAIVSRRAGLMIGVDEAFGSKEPSAFLDPNSGNQPRPVTFDHIRRYGFNLTGYPIRGPVEPYLGVGFGLLQVLNPQLGGVFASPESAALSQEEASNRSASGFVSLLAGLQFRVGRIAAFGQYQLSSAPAAGGLLRGPGHSLMGGLRFSLGSSRSDIKGGGY